MLYTFDRTSIKKEVFLNITKKYLPDNYEVLKNYDEKFVDFIAAGDSLQDYFYEYPTVIHEAFHVFDWKINAPAYSDGLCRYRLNDTLTIIVKNLPLFLQNKLIHSLQRRIRKLCLHTIPILIRPTLRM